MTHRRTWLRQAAVAVSALALGLGRQVARAQTPDVLPLAVHIVERSTGGPLRDADWLSARVERASAAFTPAGATFRVAARPTLSRDHVRIESAAGRDALAEYVDDSAIHVFVVHTLASIEGRDHFPIDGVHWRGGGAHFVILSAFDREDTLAHELGHYFGLGHTRGRDLMNQRRPEEARFSARQLRALRPRLRRAAASFG